MWSQFATAKVAFNKKRFLPYVFTEQGVSMLAGILRSKIAIELSIRIINAFVSMREFINSNNKIFFRLDDVERKQFSYEIKTEEKFEKIFNAMQNYKVNQGIFYDGQTFDAYIFITIWV